jgi:hypothetical protein
MLKQQTWLILSHCLLLLLIILLRYSTVLHCDFFILMYLCQAFYCVSNFCIRHFIMCQSFYLMSAISSSCSHFMLSLSFTCCLPATFLCVSNYMMCQSFLCCGSQFRLSKSFPSCVSAILCYLNHFQFVWQPFYVLATISYCASHSIFYQSFYLFVSVIYMCQPFYVVWTILFWFKLCNTSLFILYYRKCWLMSVIWMHLVDLLPRKIVKTLACLVTRARPLGGEVIKLLSREVREKLLQHIHMMTVWMTFSSHHNRWRRIQVPKFLRREVLGKKVSAMMAIYKAQGAKEVSWPLQQLFINFSNCLAFH